MIIDFHTHGVPASQPRIADIAMTDLFGRWVAKTAYNYAHNAAFTDHTIDGPKGLLASMERAGIGISVLLPVVIDPKQVTKINERTLEMVRHFPDKLRSFAAFHPWVDDLEGTISTIKAQGFVGVKLHTIRGGWEPCSNRAFQAYALLDRYGLYATFDTYSHPEELTPPMEDNFPNAFLTTPALLSEIHDQFPGLKMIVAHLGWPIGHRDVERYLVGKKLYFDVSFAKFVTSEARARQIMLGHDPSLILFGSDYPAGTQEESIAWINSLKLPAEMMAKIMEENARRILGV